MFSITDIKKMKRINKFGFMGVIVFLLALTSKIFLLLKYTSNKNVSLSLWSIFRYAWSPSGIQHSKGLNVSEIISIICASQIITYGIISTMYLAVCLMIFHVLKQYELFAQKIIDLER